MPDAPACRSSALDEQLLDEVLRVGGQLAEHDAHAGRIRFDPDDLAEPLDRLDVFHDDRESQVDERTYRQGPLRLDEDAAPRDVRHVFLDERVERLELLVDRHPLVAALARVVHRRSLYLPARSNCSRWYSVRAVTWMRRM